MALESSRGTDRAAGRPDPSILVCGAGGGIGRALVRRFLDGPGHGRVFATTRQGADDAALGPGGGDARLTGVRMDVTDEASVAAAAARVGAAVERLDLVVNCAGVLHDGDAVRPERRLEDVDPRALARGFAVNAAGPLLVAKHFAPLLPRRGRCVFASLSARVGSIGDNRLGGWYTYRASKAAHNMIIRNLSIELRRRSRDVICVALHPGTVDTALSRPFQRSVPARQLLSPDEAARRLVAVIEGLDPADNGGFFAHDGTAVPW